MKTYSAAEVSAWTQADMDALAGKTITLTDVRVTQTRTVLRAYLDGNAHRPGATATVEWVGGGSWTWTQGAANGATITVHEDPV